MCGAIEKLRKMGWKTSKQIFLSLKCYVTSIEIIKFPSTITQYVQRSYREQDIFSLDISFYLFDMFLYARFSS